MGLNKGPSLEAREPNCRWPLKASNSYVVAPHSVFSEAVFLRSYKCRAEPLLKFARLQKME